MSFVLAFVSCNGTAEKTNKRKDSSKGEDASKEEVASKEVIIGNQVWMTKNLDVSTFRNGDPIPEAKTDEEWEKAGENKKPAWCYWDNDPANGAKYGKLYNWHAVNDPRGLAPDGYHIPTDAEWKILTKYLGEKAGTKMKSTSGWLSHTEKGSKTCSNCENWNPEYRSKVPCHTCKDTRRVDTPEVIISGGTNSSGFSGLPGGIRDYEFNLIDMAGTWWSSTKFGKFSSCDCYLHFIGDVIINFSQQFKGLSVRCLKD